MRTYHFTASRPGGFMNWPGAEATSNLRIRAVAIIIFRKWFGLNPTTSWGVDGFMGEAWDERGNQITVEQINNAPGECQSHD